MIAKPMMGFKAFHSAKAAPDGTQLRLKGVLEIITYDNHLLYKAKISKKSCKKHYLLTKRGVHYVE